MEWDQAAVSNVSQMEECCFSDYAELGFEM